MIIICDIHNTQHDVISYYGMHNERRSPYDAMLKSLKSLCNSYIHYNRYIRYTRTVMLTIRPVRS